MKPRLIIFSLTLIVLILTIANVVNANNTSVTTEEGVSTNLIPDRIPVTNNTYNVHFVDFVYDVNSRFMTTITKEKLLKAKSVLDIVPKEAKWDKLSVETVVVAVLKDAEEIIEIGNEMQLNTAQMNLLKSVDYSSNIYIKTRAINNNYKNKSIEDFAYYITIVPEKETAYNDGHAIFMAYLKEKSRSLITHLNEDQLQAGKIVFTITKNGTIENVQLESSSGYKSIDTKMIEIIKNAPGTWTPAENAKGEKVNQTLVFSFGKMGC
ncbi:energy transducer TonB [Geojedonia litorea]|uniref:Energy transducer TonB n=1 Tax=Geojedonia litorea TaxID=1268269 RepID=A0ABV9N9B8_9FLAO